MQADDKLLKIISNETKNSIDQLPIVTPSIYASIFSKFATNHNTNIENEKELAQDLMVMECSNLTDLQTQASKNAIQLSQNTRRAIDAIKNKNESVLNEVLKETSDLRNELEKLKEAVYKDELTHVYNRKWLHDNLLEDESEKFKKDGTLAIIDLNYFKIINDTYGHIVGDKVLIFIANQLKKTRESIVRYGGDEFIILFSNNTSHNSAITKLNEIREDIITKKLKAQESSFKVSFSFGVNEFKNGDDLASTIELADKNMYDDKIQIKKRVTGI